MSILSGNKRKSNVARVIDGVPQAVAHGAEDAAHRLADAAETTGSRVAKRAEKASHRASDLSGDLSGKASHRAGDLTGKASDLSGKASGKASDLSGKASGKASELSGKASELGGQIGGRASDVSGQLNGRANELTGHIGGSKSKLNGVLSGAGKNVRTRFRTSPDVIIKAQLAKTSRELAHESSDLGQAVDSLNSVIKANRKAAARGRTRLIGGLVIGAAAMYHLDAEHGRQRRAATARRISGIVRGGKSSQT
jgi:uncharacterized protein YjbJ (UPF0337 family)